MRIGILSCEFGWEEEQLCRAASDLGHRVMKTAPRSVPISVTPNHISLGGLEEMDRVLIRRTVEARDVVSAIARALKRLNVPTLEHADRYTTSEASKVASVLERWKHVPVPRSWVVWDVGQIGNLLSAVSWPVVCKPNLGRQGRGVVLVHDPDALLERSAEHFGSSPSEPLFLQEYVQVDREYRVLVLNGQPMATCLKHRLPGEVAASAALGTPFVNARVRGISEGELVSVERMAVHAAKVPELLFAGADVAVDNHGSMCVFECNRNPKFSVTQQAFPEVDIALRVMQCLVGLPSVPSSISCDRRQGSRAR